MKVILQALLGLTIAVGAARAAPPTDEDLAALYAQPSPFESVARDRWIAESENAYVILARKAAQQEGIARNGFRIVINTHPQGSQSVYHFHMHVLGGRQMKWPPG